MKRWWVAGLWVCLAAGGCATTARDSGSKVVAVREDTLGRELSPLREHAFGDDAVGFVASTESSGVPNVSETDGLVRVTIPFGDVAAGALLRV